jgi:predicted negative regulator of RcsB-dependent stress response
MSTAHVLAAAANAGPNANVTIIWTVIPSVLFIAAAVIGWSYFRLQAHRADAVAMAEYRKLAEDAVANQQELRAELARLTEKVGTVEKLMRDVG